LEHSSVQTCPNPTPRQNQGPTLFNVGDMPRFLDRLAKEQAEAGDSEPKEGK
jgi:hypothetical protein